jgi:hypothetical protein
LTSRKLASLAAAFNSTRTARGVDLGQLHAVNADIAVQSAEEGVNVLARGGVEFTDNPHDVAAGPNSRPR